jgi:hypothetical protein
MIAAYALGRFLRGLILLVSGGAIAVAVSVIWLALRTWMRARRVRRFEAALALTLAGVALILYLIADLLFRLPYVRPTRQAWEYTVGALMILFGTAGLAVEWRNRKGAK